MKSKVPVVLIAMSVVMTMIAASNLFVANANFSVGRCHTYGCSSSVEVCEPGCMALVRDRKTCVCECMYTAEWNCEDGTYRACPMGNVVYE